MKISADIKDFFSSTTMKNLSGAKSIRSQTACIIMNTSERIEHMLNTLLVTKKNLVKSEVDEIPVVKSSRGKPPSHKAFALAKLRLTLISHRMSEKENLLMRLAAEKTNEGKTLLKAHKIIEAYSRFLGAFELYRALGIQSLYRLSELNPTEIYTEATLKDIEKHLRKSGENQAAFKQLERLKWRIIENRVDFKAELVKIFHDIGDNNIISAIVGVYIINICLENVKGSKFKSRMHRISNRLDDLYFGEILHPIDSADEENNFGFTNPYPSFPPDHPTGAGAAKVKTPEILIQQIALEEEYELFCSNCGSKLAKEDGFCKVCKEKITE